MKLVLDNQRFWRACGILLFHVVEMLAPDYHWKGSISLTIYNYFSYILMERDKRTSVNVSVCTHLCVCTYMCVVAGRQFLHGSVLLLHIL